ncbi:MAG: septal ring lytic transglycosylase RlpA family protein [Ignavibacteriaceae bacterium]|nr:septal ring lytic transglycosylase RlpA family protein [Ignavibacteriaceae bacterium]
MILVIAGFTTKTAFLTEASEDQTVSAAEPVVETTETEPVTTVVSFNDKGLLKASWYGPGFHGRVTANGETYDQEAFTAAHKKLKFGTLLRLTNPKNGKSVIVRINDRGPYIPGRELDLSKGAARELGLIQKGVARIQVEEVTLQGGFKPEISLN